MSSVSSPIAELSTKPGPAPVRRWTTIVALVCAFVAGTAVGVGGTLQFHHRSRMGMFRNPQDAAREYASQLRSRLQLTDEQFAEVSDILERRHNEFETFRREMHPRVAGIFDAMEDEVAAVLTPEQIAGFEQIKEERHRMFPPPPPPPPEKKK